MKKFFLAFACSAVPFSASVASVIIIDPVTTPGANEMTSFNVPVGDYARIISGSGLALGTGGMSVGELYVGKNSTDPTSPIGEVFVEPTASANYSIRSDGDISISGLLDVLDGYSLGIGAKTQGETIATVSIGSINADGAFSTQDVGTLNTGNITSNAALTLNAGAINTTGTIDSTAGNITINVTNALGVSGDIVAGGNAITTIDVGSMSVGSLQNMSGTMTVTSDGVITSTGNIENSGASMSVTGTNMTVGGTMKNDSNGGTMSLTLNSLRINGGSGNNASFVNKGDLSIDVLGETYLENGFDLSAMTATNTFSLHTGTLVMNGGADSLLQVFENNKLTSFELVVSNGAIAAGNIANGQSNAAANMTLTAGAGGISATTIQNRGDNLIVSTIEDSAGNITVDTLSGTSVYGAAGSTTHINADGTLSVNGAVSNSGTMILNGNVINLAGVSNNGTLTIAAQTDPTGKIYLTGGVNNSGGTTEINARQVQIDGVVTTTAGATNIKGSDANNGASVLIGGIDALGGVTTLDSLIHSATITGNLLASSGAFNVGVNTYELNVNGGVQINNDLTFSGTNASGAGDVNIANSGVNRFVLTSGGQMNIDGDVVAEDNAVARSGALVADVIEIGGDISVANKGNVAFGNASSTTLSITGDVTANDGGTIEIYSGATTLKSLSGNGKFIMHGNSVSATTGNINVSNGIWYGDYSVNSGMLVNNTDELTLRTTNANRNVSVTGGISITDGVLNIVSANDANISGAVNVSGAGNKLTVTANDGDIVVGGGTVSVSDSGAVEMVADTIQTGAISNGANSSVTIGDANTTSVSTNGLVSNAGVMDITGTQVTMTSIETTSGGTQISATNALQITSVVTSGGAVTLGGTSIAGTSMELTGGATTLASNTINVSDTITVSNGDISQGGAVGVLILSADETTLNAKNLTVDGGKLVVDDNDVVYNITNDATFANGITVNDGGATINAAGIDVGGLIKNDGELILNTPNDLELGAVQNTGTLFLNTTGGTLNAASLTNSSGTVQIMSDDMTLTGALNSNGVLYQDYSGSIPTGAVNIQPTDYTLSAASVIVGGINQSDSSAMVIKSSDVTVNGNITANDLRIEASNTTNWLNVDVTGNIYGNLDLVGLEHMHVGGNYTFDDNSMLHVAVLPTPGVVINATTYNYWSSVSLADDNTYGQITNAQTDAAPLISVDGQFIYDVSNVGPELSDDALVNPQIGIDIFHMVDSGTAIWLLHSDSANGLAELSDKIRNLNVNFCNADGTRCFKYFNNSIAENASAGQTESNLPAYLTVRDIDQDGVTDSIYIVFDSRFGGPTELFKIQPIVDRVDGHTDGEHDAAGALDDMIEGQLLDTNFTNPVPIEALPVAFDGTIWQDLADELYKRMEEYLVNPDGVPLKQFSRLVEPRELKQVMGNISLDEHTTFRDFEDHMFDEFIWNRHRSLNKVWFDADFGLFYQDIGGGQRADGNRFSVVAGYDWQQSSTLILGLTGRISHIDADSSENIDLGYIPGQSVNGRAAFDVSDTNIGVGAYMMKILGTKTRVYGNGFFDAHLIDVSREESFMPKISGSTTAFSLISEWGLLHDWLNQYIVGNAYARFGYNFGYSIKEKASGDEYLNMKTDGYMIFTPGYSLIAQKRIYPTSWFQIRPYASVGIEYDVLGSPDYAKFKFGPAKKYTEYSLEIDPLWANIGGGVELLSATGFQMGLDYRYQYNDTIQLHKIRLSGSYRF